MGPVVTGFLASRCSFRGVRNLNEGRPFGRGSGFSAGASGCGVGSGPCCDGVGGGDRFPLSLGLRSEAPTRRESYEGVSVVIRAAAGALRLARHQQVPCSPEVVGNIVRVAPPRTLVSSDVGVFGASSAWLLT